MLEGQRRQLFLQDGNGIAPVEERGIVRKRKLVVKAANEIQALIKAALPDARITVEDLAGDGDHYAANVVSEQFRGLSRVRQHQIVYAALRGRMGGELHALALQTSAPE